MKKNPNQIVSTTFQQGDVLLRRLDKMPHGERKVVSRGRCVLAHGESGHAHVVEDSEAELIAIGERMLLTIAKPTPVRHEEHGVRTLEPGIWDVGRVREYDYLSEMVRPVQD